MRGRTPPARSVPVLFVEPRDGDPSQAIDAAFFEQHPHKRSYTRMYIPGETIELMHPDTWVFVTMRGVERVRAFAPPSDVGRAN